MKRYGANAPAAILDPLEQHEVVGQEVFGLRFHDKIECRRDATEPQEEARRCAPQPHPGQHEIEPGARERGEDGQRHDLLAIEGGAHLRLVPEEYGAFGRPEARLVREVALHPHGERVRASARTSAAGTR